MSTADEAWNAWLRHRPIAPNQREVFMAGYRRALEDAADEVRNSNAVYAYLRPASIETWLRAAAADVGPRQTVKELREAHHRGIDFGVGTKDGDDDE